MRELKLVIWDLDETLITGVFAENDRDVDTVAQSLMARLYDRGTLQALATQNETEVMNEAVSHYGWEKCFQFTAGDLAPKQTKVAHILEGLGVSADHTVFVDNDPFERALMRVQVPGLLAWSVQELAAYVDALQGHVTEEARMRPEMYRALREQKTDEEIADDLEAFLTECDIRVLVRRYEATDEPRAIELLTRTNRMNLATPRSPANIVAAPAPTRLVIAELTDRYGDSGRCGLISVTPQTRGVGAIDSIAISCRARARGLSLAILIGMLQHPLGQFDTYRCVFRPTGRNRPLRMLLWAAGFSQLPGSQVLRAERRTLSAVVIPPWVRIEHLARGSDVADGTSSAATGP